MTLQDIQSVQLTDSDGYILNESLYVPNDQENGHYQLIQAWIAAGHTPEPAATIPAAQLAINAEYARLQAAIPTPQQVTLDAQGSADIEHSIDSLWYLVRVTPLDEAMPDLYVKKHKTKVQLKDGEANGVVAVKLEMFTPPAGSESLILSNP